MVKDQALRWGVLQGVEYLMQAIEGGMLMGDIWDDEPLPPNTWLVDFTNLTPALNPKVGGAVASLVESRHIPSIDVDVTCTYRRGFLSSVDINP